MECRNPAFTHFEKKVFSEILKKYSKIIENKKNHTSALRLKNLTWQRIAVEFNSSPGANFHRTPKQLRRLWLNLKQRQKDELSRRQYQSTEIASDSTLTLMDSDNFVDTEIGIVDSELVLSEETQNIICSETPLVSEIKIEPISYINIDPVETESTIPEQIPPLRLNNTAHSTHQKQYSTDHIEYQRASERHQLEILLLKEKIRCQQQEHRSKQEQARVMHNLEYQVLEEKFREAKAKADLAELLLRRQQ